MNELTQHLDYAEPDRTSFDVGKPMRSEDYLSSSNAFQKMVDYIAQVSTSYLEERQLSQFHMEDTQMLPRMICLPTTLLMAVRHLTHTSDLDLGHFYEIGIATHLNDELANDDVVRKGFPSFHRKSLDTYLRYALEFAKIASLSGGVITDFKDLSFAPTILQHGIFICSVDNLFIPHVMNTNLDPQSFKSSRHAELVHGLSNNQLVVSDVTNTRNGITWESRNRLVTFDNLESHLTCPRLNDSFTRAIVITKNEDDWQHIQSELSLKAHIEDGNFNPILKPYFSRGVFSALERVRELNGKNISGWAMVDSSPT